MDSKTITFEDTQALTETVGSNASFEPEECEAYFNILSIVPIGSLVVEIGVEFGRSTSVLMQMAGHRSFRVHLIDPFLTYRDLPLQAQPQTAAMGMITNAGYPVTLHVRRSGEAANAIPGNLGCVLIDGDHTTKGVQTDCQLYLGKVAQDGYALFHDYGRGSLPEVTSVVDGYLQLGWERVNQVGSLLIARKIRLWDLVDKHNNSV
jgi:hypothetical protein